MIDFLGYEPHFIDHLAPVWHAMPRQLRGRFITDPHLVAHANRLDIAAIGLVAPKRVPAYPDPREDGIPAVVASYGDIKKGRRMGYGPFAFLEHGIGQSYSGDRQNPDHASYSGGVDRDDVQLNLVPNQNSAARWAAAYPDARTEVIGCPKLDALPSRDGGEGPVVAVSFHFQASVAAETAPALSHFLPALTDLSKRFTTIGHAHPRFYGIDRTYKRHGIPFVADFADVCRQADVYVCDNSSTLYEFASTGRPVVVLNAPSYRREVHHGLRFWEAANVGIQVDHPDDLISAVEEALADASPRKRAREAALDIVYAYRSGAARRAAEAIGQWVGAREAVAA